MEKNDILIRPALPADLTGIVEALQEYHFRLLPTGPQEKIDPQGLELLAVYNEVTLFDLERAFVAEVDGQIAGCAHYRPLSDTEAQTTLLVVREAYRRYGLGRQLQAARMKAAQAAGAQVMTTYCDTEPSALWYQKHFSYQVVGESENRHRIYCLQAGQDVRWGIHYGFPGQNRVVKMTCDLNKYFNKLEYAV